MESKRIRVLLIEDNPADADKSMYDKKRVKQESQANDIPGGIEKR